MEKVELPKDALGREIPLDIKVLYDEYGEEFFIDKVTHMRMTGSWWLSGHFGLQSVEHQYRASRLHITRPDSWKELLKDLDEGANHSEYSYCFYFRKDGCDCSLCEADRYSGCDQPAFKDIASRIRKLMGECNAD